MANKRDISKQKRARQNRAQRDALKARTEAASVEPEQRRTKATATPAPVKGKKARREPADRPARAVRPGDVPVDIDDLQGNWLAKRMEVPGGRQVFTGFVLAVLLAGLMAVMPLPGNEDITAKDLTGKTIQVTFNRLPTQTVFDVYGWIAVPAIALPVVALGFAVAYTATHQRRRVWIGVTILVALQVLLGFTVFLFPAGFVVYGLWRASKVEGTARTGGRPSPWRRGPAKVAGADAADSGSAGTDDGDDQG